MKPIMQPEEALAEISAMMATPMRFSLNEMRAMEHAVIALEVCRMVPPTNRRVLVDVDGGICQSVSANFADLEVILRDTDQRPEKPEDAIHVSIQNASIITDPDIEAAINSDTRAGCQVCSERVGPKDPYFSSPCGTFCDECMSQHWLECGVCAKEFKS